MFLQVVGGQVATNVIALLLLLATGIYVVLTGKIARANSVQIATMNEQFQETVRPVIVVSIKVRVAQLLCLEIENFGRSPAHRLRLTIDRDFFQFADMKPDHNLRNFHAFQQEIQTFAPGARLRFDLAQGFNFDKEANGTILTPSMFVVRAEYSSLTKKYYEDFHIDIRPYMNTNWTKTADESLENIERHISKLAR